MKFITITLALLVAFSHCQIWNQGQTQQTIGSGDDSFNTFDQGFSGFGSSNYPFPQDFPSWFDPIPRYDPFIKKINHATASSSLGKNEKKVYILNPRKFTKDVILEETAALFVQSGYDFEILSEALQINEDNLVVSIEKTFEFPFLDQPDDAFGNPSTTLFITVDEEGELHFSGILEHNDFFMFANRVGCHEYHTFEKNFQVATNLVCLFGLNMGNSQNEDLLYVDTLEEYCEECQLPSSRCVAGYQVLCNEQNRRILQSSEDISNQQSQKSKQAPSQDDQKASGGKREKKLEDQKAKPYKSDKKKTPVVIPQRNKKEELQERIRIEEVYINKMSN